MAASLEGADKDFANSVNRLMAENKGIGLTSGFRNNAEQTALYNQAVKQHGEAEAGKWAAKPGSSNHEHGVAADISGYQNITDAQLAKYGLYRPMSWEPWHVEPISTKAKRGGSAAYTTPPVDAATAKTIDGFQKAVQSLMGPAEATTGAAESVTGAADSMVGATGTNESITNKPAEQPVTAATTSVGGTPTAASSAPANESAYMKAFNDAGTKYGISPKLLQEVARAESGFNPNAGSGAGAIGLMQFMPGTAKGLGIDPRDPYQSIDGAARLLSGYLEQYGGDVSKALAAYNAGPGAVQKYGGVPPYKETQNYVAKITGRLG